MAKTGELDPRLSPGAILLIEDDAQARTVMCKILRSPDLVGRKHEVIPVASVAETKRLLVPPRPGPGEPRRSLPRPPLSGIIMDWYLGRGGTALEALAFLDEVYPFTPMLVYSGADDLREMRSECTRRQIVCRQKPFGPDVLRTVIDSLFVPLDDERVAFRRWVIDRAGPNGITEHLLRVCEGRVLDELDKERGAVAHGVIGDSLEHYALQIKARVGVALESLRGEYRRHEQGRGAARFSGILPAQSAPSQQEALQRPRRPAARRGR